MKIPFSCYDNWAQLPMKICLGAGVTLVGSALYSSANEISATGRDSGGYNIYFTIGLICLGLFVVFKIINWRIAINEQDDELFNVVNDLYTKLVSDGLSPNVAKNSIKSYFADKYKNGEIDPNVCARLFKLIDNRLE